MKRLSEEKIAEKEAGALLLEGLDFPFADESARDLREFATALREAYEREDRIRKAIKDYSTKAWDGEMITDKIQSILDEETK